MSVLVSVDGEIVRGDAARVPALDRGFLFGDSAFEVTRTYQRDPFSLREHLARLARSCELLLIPMPCTLAELDAEIRSLLARAEHAESYIRVVVTRGQGPLNYDPTTAEHPSRVVFVAPVPQFPPAIYTDGVSAACLHVTRPTDALRARGAKASNYLAHLLAAHEARQQGAFEAIVLGPLGEVYEGATSNVFIVRRGAVVTPPVTAPILVGITRTLVIEDARDLGVPVAEEMLFPQDFYAADEAFLTSSLREVVPVVRVDGVTIGAGKPGPVTLRLLDAYRSRTARGGRGSEQRAETDRD